MSRKRARGGLKKVNLEIDIKELNEHFLELASFDIAEERINKNLDFFLRF